MSDYWKKFGEEIAAKKKAGWLVCRYCGNLYKPPGACGACEYANCVTCGNKFLALGKRKRCDDCVGERSESQTPTEGSRISEGNRMKRDDDE